MDKIIESLEKDEQIAHERIFLYRLVNGVVECTSGAAIYKILTFGVSHIYFKSDENPKKSKSRIAQEPGEIQQSALWLGTYDIEYARSLFVKYEQEKIKDAKLIIMRRENIIMQLELAGTRD